jgi:4-amino-4-deoxy-L-arabinose transferase-like glycosyltransferase
VIVTIVLLAMAAGLRFWGIGRESFWYDEAETARLSDHCVAEVLEDNAKDVHPPLYYLGLHFWRAALGDSDVRIRAYSLVWSLVGVFAVLLLGSSIGGWRVGTIALLLAAVNPLDVYYAQEARNYAQGAALCTLSSWCLWQWMAATAAARERTRRFAIVGYCMFASAALYTHYLSVMILVAQGLFVGIRFGRRRSWRTLAIYAGSALSVTLLFLPWYILVLHFRPTFYHPDLAWIQVPRFSDYYTILGREFLVSRVWSSNHAWWHPGMAVSLPIIGICGWCALRCSTIGAAPSTLSLRMGIGYLAWLLACPVLLAALAVAVYHPIYYRSRFALFVLPPFLVLAAIGCVTLRRRAAIALGVALLAGIMLNNTWRQYERIEKGNWRGFAEVWRKKGPPGHAAFFWDGIQAAAEYYLKEPLVFPQRDEIEKQLPAIAGSQLWVCSMWGYVYNQRPGEFEDYQWLLALGPVHNLVLRDFLLVQVVTIPDPPLPPEERLDRWFAPIEIPGKIEGFVAKQGFSILEYDRDTSAAFRWSGAKGRFCLRAWDRPGTVILNVQVPPPVPAGFQPDLKFFVRRGQNYAEMFDGPPFVTIPGWQAGPFEVRLFIAATTGPVWIGWTANTVNLKKAEVSGDDRDLGLRTNWVGVKWDRGG